MRASLYKKAYCSCDRGT